MSFFRVPHRPEAASNVDDRCGLAATALLNATFFRTSLGVSASRRFKRTSLVFEVPAAGEEHGEAVVVAGGDGVLVTARSARLDEGAHAGGGRRLD